MRRYQPKSVLAVIDAGPAATAATWHAAHLAHTNAARLVLLDAFSPLDRLTAGFLQVFRRATPRRRPPALSSLQHTAARLVAGLGVPVEIKVAPSNAPAEITAHARASDAGLIVIGQRRVGFLQRLLDMNAAHELRITAGIPVLTVSPYAAMPYRRLLLAVDFSRAAVAAAHFARAIFPGCTLDVLHVVEPPYTTLMRIADASPNVLEEHGRQALREARDRMRYFTQEAGLSDGSVDVRLGQTVVCIRRRLREQTADLLVLPATPFLLSQWPLHGIAEQFLADPPCEALLLG